MTEKDIKLLTSMYQNCQIAKTSINDIEPSADSRELRAELREEMARYDEFSQKCEMLANHSGVVLPDNNFIEKAKIWTSIKMTTLTDKSTRHLAEMLLLGTVMGTLQCYKDLCDYRDCDPDLLKMCGLLLQIEEKHFNYLKMFLKSC